MVQERKVFEKLFGKTKYETCSDRWEKMPISWSDPWFYCP